MKTLVTLIVILFLVVSCGNGSNGSLDIQVYEDCNEKIRDMEASLGFAETAISCANSEQEDWWSSTYWYWCQGIRYTFTQNGSSCEESIQQIESVCGLDSPAFIQFEHQSNPFTSQGSYSIAFSEGVLWIKIKLKLIGYPVSEELLNRYEKGIEDAWSTDRFEVPIRIDVVWTDDEPDKVIKVVSGVGRWHTSQWHTAGWVEEIVAHEAGHYFGLYDEYGGGDAQGFDGGAAPGPRPNHPRGLMSHHSSPVLDYYYDGFLTWFNEKENENDSTF